VVSVYGLWNYILPQVERFIVWVRQLDMLCFNIRPTFWTTF
jgi:hypothetical protein